MEENWWTQRRSYQFGFLRSAVKDHENHNEILCQWCKLPRIVIIADERKEIINTKIIKRQKCVFCPQGNIQWGVDTLPMFIFLCKKKKKIQPRKKYRINFVIETEHLKLFFRVTYPYLMKDHSLHFQQFVRPGIWRLYSVFVQITRLEGRVVVVRDAHGVILAS